MLFVRLALITIAGSLAAVAAHAQQVTVRVPGCESPMWRYRFNGVSFVKVSPLAGAEGVYTLSNDVDRVTLAYLGAEGSAPLPVLLDGRESFTVTGNCLALTEAVVDGSAVNDAYQAFKREMSESKEGAGRLTQQLRLAPEGSPAHAEAFAALGDLDRARAERLDALQAAGREFEAAAWAANLYTSYEHTQKPYGSELDYFGNERFQYADFSQAAYAGNPWVFESFREVTGMLAQSGLAPEGVRDYLRGFLALAVNYPATHKLALGGVVATLRQAQNPLAVPFAREYLERYGAEEPEAAATLEAEIARLAAFADGGVAPDFRQNLLSGEGDAGPADYRGKVLLIDFWASWCGPCRRENPNVVAMYNEFKDSGFEILGVSLDRSEDAWRKAVAQDGLTWPHVSDLQGWSNAAAQQYGVRSIPATVLLDREGRIVARNLRGEDLRQKVAELVASED